MATTIYRVWARKVGENTATIASTSVAKKNAEHIAREIASTEAYETVWVEACRTIWTAGDDK